MEDRGKRRYDRSGRRSSADRTRRRIIEGGAQLFLENGYARTSIDAIAEAAEVSPATVYKVFGNKVAIAKAVGDVAVVGDHEPVPLDQRRWVRAALAEPDAELALELVVRNGVALLARISPIIEMINAAALGEPQLTALVATADHGRRQGFLTFTRSLQARGQLRQDLSVDDAADVLYALQSPQTFLALVQGRGWSVERFGHWLLDQTRYAVLGSASAVSSAQP